jgi:hypothetical protein
MPLNGIGTSLASIWTDSGVTGASINQLVTGLTAVTPYHWRVRLRYHQATTPFQLRSRWLTVPRNGWQEQDLRTASAFAGTVGPTVFLANAQSSAISLTWAASCLDTDFDFAIYEGKIGVFPSHAVRACSTNGATSATLTPGTESHYYLIVPQNDFREGLYGVSSSGEERLPAVNACLTQELGRCE